MERIQSVGRVLLALAATLAAHASGPVGVYARIDKVVPEPNTDAPDRIQVWGIFSIRASQSLSDYTKPARGYLYFKLDRDPETTRNEWKDLKTVAGTGEIVAFGGSFAGDPPRLRKADEKPDRPDPYVLNFGVRKVDRNSEDPKVRALAEYKDAAN